MLRKRYVKVRLIAADDAETLGNLLRSSLDMYRSVIGRRRP